MSIAPAIGSPMSCATLLRPPSAPIRYFARIWYVSPDNRSRTVAVTPSSSCSSDTYSVSNRNRAPRLAAVLTRMGSNSVCGRSQGRVGLASV